MRTVDMELGTRGASSRSFFCGEIQRLAVMLTLALCLAANLGFGQEAGPAAPVAEEAGGQDDAASDDAAASEGSETGGAGQLTAEQQEWIEKFLGVLKDSVVLIVGWGVAATLVFFIPIPWISIAFKNEKGWGWILLLVYVLGCVTPLTGLVCCVYALKHRLEYKKLFLLTVLGYAGFFGSSSYVGYRVTALTAEMESLAVDAESMEMEREGAEAAPKAEEGAGGAWGGVMDKVKAVAEKAGERSKAGDAAMAEPSADAKADGGNDADKPADPDTAKKPEGEAQKEMASEPEPESDPVDDGGYAPAPREFRVISLIGTDARRTAMIAGADGKNHLVGKGYELTLGGKDIEVVDITADAVVIRMKGRATPMAIRAPKPKQ